MPHIKDFAGRRAHMIGIGGSSMSGLALMIKRLGVHVTGSDSVRSYATDGLEAAGIPVHIGHDAAIGIEYCLICRRRTTLRQ